VVDLGCGTGILGLLCIEAGASHVVAIDSGGMDRIAKEAFRRAGLSGRATFIADHSTRACLAEQVDLVICDQVGYFGFDAGIVEFCADARRRFLKPGGTMIPAKLHLHVAGVESDAAYRRVSDWEGEAVMPALRWLRGHAVNTKHPVRLRLEELLTPASPLGTIDLLRDDPGLFSWRATLRVDRDGTLHGVAGWFDCELAPGVSMTNSPLAAKPIDRSQAFLPIEEPVRVHAGEELAVSVMARPAEDVVAWVVETASGRRFKHSTWEGMLLGPEDLVRAAPNRVPRVNAAGAARAIVLGYCDGHRTAREVEEAVLRGHPDLFPSRAEIVRFVAHVLGRDAG
jgi:protein arginine N-methyltransferase 1